MGYIEIMLIKLKKVVMVELRNRIKALVKVKKGELL